MNVAGLSRPGYNAKKSHLRARGKGERNEISTNHPSLMGRNTSRTNSQIGGRPSTSSSSKLFAYFYTAEDTPCAERVMQSTASMLNAYANLFPSFPTELRSLKTADSRARLHIRRYPCYACDVDRYCKKIPRRSRVYARITRRNFIRVR